MLEAKPTLDLSNLSKSALSFLGSSGDDSASWTCRTPEYVGNKTKKAVTSKKGLGSGNEALVFPEVVKDLLCFLGWGGVGGK